MKADDPRHGTVAGYNRIPCREECCKRAMAKYRAGLELDGLRGKKRIVPAFGMQRRLQALAAIGWSHAAVAREAGIHHEVLPRLMHAKTINRETHNRIARTYDRLSMTIPPARGNSAAYTRKRAADNGWAPPLAWDAIDDPDATPHVGTKRANPHHEQTDERHATLADLDAWRYGISEACRRLNTSRDALEAWSYRHGEAEVYQRLVERENYAEKVNGSTAERRVS